MNDLLIYLINSYGNAISTIYVVEYINSKSSKIINIQYYILVIEPNVLLNLQKFNNVTVLKMTTYTYVCLIYIMFYIYTIPCKIVLICFEYIRTELPKYKYICK